MILAIVDARVCICVAVCSVKRLEGLLVQACHAHLVDCGLVCVCVSV